MKFKTYASKAPKIISAPLFGDRSKYGFIPDENDPDWKEWLAYYHLFYESTQKSGIGTAVNNAGYKILSDVSFADKKVLEVGPGGLHHLSFWCNTPDFYSLVDLDEEFLTEASSKLNEAKIPHDMRLTSRSSNGTLPAADNEFDMIVSFYSLEHLYPFPQHLFDMLRVLKPGGRIIGAIPTEGGLAWGLGRYLTSRQWLKKNTNINPDKIICWEHPSMANEILNCLSDAMDIEKLDYWPLRIPFIDFNLVIKFIFTKRAG